MQYSHQMGELSSPKWGIGKVIVISSSSTRPESVLGQLGRAQRCCWKTQLASRAKCGRPAYRLRDSSSTCQQEQLPFRRSVQQGFPENILRHHMAGGQVSAQNNATCSPCPGRILSSAGILANKRWNGSTQERRAHVRAPCATLSILSPPPFRGRKRGARTRPHSQVRSGLPPIPDDMKE